MADFAAPIQITETSNPIGVDAVYDGNTIIHMLINTLDGHIKDYPFNITTNTFNTPIILASNGGTVAFGPYVGTSGLTGIVDLSGNLQIAYWTSDNHILHREYTYNSSANTLTPISALIQVDTAGSANHPSVAISPMDNSLTIAWVSEADNPPQIRTRTRASSGTWGGILSASTASVWTSTAGGINIDQGPSLMIDSTGIKHVTYIQSYEADINDYGRIHYVINNGSGWVDHALNAFTHDPALAINSAGELYIIGHGHPANPSCTSMFSMCIIKQNADGTWGNPQLFALPPGGNSFDSSASVKWSVVGWNRPDVIEFVFFMIPYDSPTLFYGRIGTSSLLTISGNAGTTDVTLSYMNGVTQTVTSQSDGSYSLQIPDNWSGTVTPTQPCFTFVPPNAAYTNVTANQIGQDYTPTFNAASGCDDLNVSIGGTPRGKFGLPAHSSTRASFTGLSNGPVQIASSNSMAFVGAERVILSVNGVPESFTEMMGLPNRQLDTTYWMPWYNDLDLATQLRFGNVSASSATVNVTIGGSLMPGSPFTLGVGQSTRVAYAGVSNGPVQIVSTQPIVAAERVLFASGAGGSFSEMMGLPNSQLDSTYWMPWYNNVDLSTQLRFGNVSSTTATVNVTIGGSLMPGSPFTLAPGASTRQAYSGVSNGPVQVVSTQPIVAAERVLFASGAAGSFTEMMGLPNSKLDSTYWMPWYDNVNLETQLRFGNVSGSTATVNVTIGGSLMPGSPFTLPPGASTRQAYTGVNTGPVQIVSNVPIVAAERLIYSVNGVRTSFSEMMGLPNSQLDTSYWMPWYNNVDLDTQLSLGAP